MSFRRKLFQHEQSLQRLKGFLLNDKYEEVSLNMVVIQKETFSAWAFFPVLKRIPSE